MRHRIFAGFLAVMITLIYLSLCSFGYIEKYFGATSAYEEGTSVMPLDGGGYLVSGAYNSTSNPANWKSFLLMLNEHGDTVWTQRNLAFNGKVKATNDNKFIYYGGTIASQAYDTIAITKADLQGNIEWSQKIFYGVCHNTVTDVLPVADGGYLVTGFFADQSCSNPTYDAFILKLDADGNKVWDNFITGMMNEQLYVVKALPDGNYATFGWTNSRTESNNVDYLLVKFTVTGKEIWRKTYGDVGDNYGYGMDVLPDGNIAMLGYTINMELLKADTDGNLQWKRTYGPSAGSSNYKVSYTSDGGLAIMGSENINGQMNTIFMKTDLTGDILWKKNWEARLREFKEKTDGSFVLTGYAHYLPDVAVIMMDSTKLLTAPTQLIKVNTGAPQALPSRNTGGVDTTGSANTNTGINTTAEQNASLRVYPNPADHTIYIEFNNPSNADYRLEVYTVTGQMVRFTDHITSGRIEMSREELVSGMYTYRLTGGGNVYAGKFVFN